MIGLRGEGGGGGGVGGVGARSAAVPKFVSCFFWVSLSISLSLCVVKAYAMKNAPHFWRIPSVSFGFGFSCFSLAFVFFCLCFWGRLHAVISSTLRRQKFIKYNDTQHLFRWPMGLSPPILKVSLSPPRLETAVQCTQAKLAAPSRMWLVCAQRCHTLTLHSLSLARWLICWDC